MIILGNLSAIRFVEVVSSGHRPPAALLSNIGPVRIPSPPLEAGRAILQNAFPMRSNMSSARLVLLTLLASFLVAGCNTVKGAGRDIESVGQKGEDVIN